jgi:hypothetical protein
VGTHLSLGEDQPHAPIPWRLSPSSSVHSLLSASTLAKDTSDNPLTLVEWFTFNAAPAAIIIAAANKPINFNLVIVVIFKKLIIDYLKKRLTAIKND